MALKGTLKDFGIADIFQLISHQSKTGVLHLATKDQEVRISFVSGDVVRAETTTRKEKDLLGAMLIRAEVISEAQLEQALELQKRTLKKLGVILVESGFSKLEDLRQVTRLQTTETLYKLFAWENGTYAFEAEEVVYDKDTVVPIQSENVLMEGFRMVDEWPMVRKRVTSYEMTFKKQKEIPAEVQVRVQQPVDDIDVGLDGALMPEKPKAKAKEFKDIGRNELNVFGLLRDDRTVQKLIDLSRLGEFETCKALYNLLNGGFIKGEAVGKFPVEKERPGSAIRRSVPWGRILVQLAMYALLAGAFYLLVQLVDVWSLLEGGQARSFQDPVARTLMDKSQRMRLETALKVYRLELGRYPEKLEELVTAELVSESELKFPWRNPRLYRPTADGYVLLRPFE